MNWLVDILVAVLFVELVCFIAGFAYGSKLPDPAQADTSAMFALIHKQRDMIAEDKQVIDALLLLDWDRNKPILTECHPVTWMDIDACRIYQ